MKPSFNGWLMEQSAKNVKNLPQTNSVRESVSNNIASGMPLIVKHQYDKFLRMERNKGKDAVDFYFIQRSILKKQGLW